MYLIKNIKNQRLNFLNFNRKYYCETWIKQFAKDEELKKNQNRKYTNEELFNKIEENKLENDKLLKQIIKQNEILIGLNKDHDIILKNQDLIMKKMKSKIDSMYLFPSR